MPERDRDEQWERLARYASGECTAEESAAVERWLAQEPARARLLAELKGATAHVRFAPPVDLDVESALATVNARIDADAVRPIATAPSRRPPAWRNPALRAAAAIVVLLGAATFLTLRARDEAPAVAATASFETGTGEADTLRLADGSTVILGAASRLVIPADYGTASRTVELHGVAWFDVVHAERAFAVRAGDALVTDLGTAFSVRADPGAPVRVSVTEGSVRLAPHTAPAAGVILQAGQRAALGGAVEASDAADPDVAWLAGRLVFADAPFSQVAAEVRRWYGLQLIAGDSVIGARHLTAEFEGEPIQDVLQVISLALAARIEQRADTVVLHSAQ